MGTIAASKIIKIIKFINILNVASVPTRDFLTVFRHWSWKWPEVNCQQVIFVGSLRSFLKNSNRHNRSLNYYSWSSSSLSSCPSWWPKSIFSFIDLSGDMQSWSQTFFLGSVKNLKNDIQYSRVEWTKILCQKNSYYRWGPGKIAPVDPLLYGPALWSVAIWANEWTWKFWTLFYWY